MADDVVELIVGELRYAGWKSIQITRSMESISGSATVTVTDRWGDEQAWPIAEEDACRVAIGGEIVIDGYVDKRSVSASKDARTLSYTIRDRAAAIVDCSALVRAGSVQKTKWVFRDVDLFEIATAICEPFGIEVSMQAGLRSALVKDKKVVVSPGDKGFEVLARLAKAAGVMLVSDGAGGIVITRSSTMRAADLVEAGNIKEASVDYDASDRFYRYFVTSQIPGSDDASGESTRIKAQAIDEGVRRTDRVLMILPDRGYNSADAKRRADWEARIRAARAEKVSILVAGWRQPSGELWTINRLTTVKASRLIGVNGELLISQVDFQVDDQGGRVTRLGLVRPDAFDPEPSATVKTSEGGAWKELTKGAL